MRFLLPLPMPRRTATRTAAAPTAPDGEGGGEADGANGAPPPPPPVSWWSLFCCCCQRGLCCPLSHLLVVVANTLQLFMMVTFLCFLLAALNEPGALSWFAVFAPLWLSDVITLCTAMLELSRACRARPESFISPRRNAVIAQINRLKGSIGVATFKFLLAMRQDGHWPHLTVVACCSPYFVAAALRLALHCAKKPVAPPSVDGGPTRAIRPGTPFNPVHPVILMLACRADQLNTISWTATFWPIWTVFGALCLASVAASVLAIGILCARHEPPDAGQRALFFLCYAFLLTVTTSGLTFLIALSSRLDGNVSVSYTLIVGPLITGYGLLLLFYLIFTIVLPPLLLRDLNAAALAEEEAENADDEAAGVPGVIEAVSQQLAPPVLVQQSSTLFKRMGNMDMFERFLPMPLTGGAPSAASAASATGSNALASVSEADDEAALSKLEEGSSGRGEAGGDVTEYETLEKDIGMWVRSQQQQAMARPRKPRPPRGSKTAPQAPETTLVPAEVKAKLRRLMSLKEQLSAAACAEACGSYISASSTTGMSPDAKAAMRKAASGGGGFAAPPPTSSPFEGVEMIRLSGEREQQARRGTQPPPPSGEQQQQQSQQSADDDNAPRVVELTELDEDEVEAEAAEEAERRRAAEPPPNDAAVQTSPPSTPPRREPGATSAADEDDDASEAASPSRMVPVDDDDEDENLCVICVAGPRDAVLLECGHGGICYACAKRCLRKKGRECPLCRAPVEQVVQIRLDGAPSSPQHTGVVRVKQADLPEEFELEDEDE